jgi:replicative DNA helicase
MPAKTQDDDKRTRGDAEAERLYNPDVERALVGALLFNNETIAAAAPLLKPLDLFDSAARATFRAAKELYDMGTAVNITTVRSRLDATGEFEQLGEYSLMDFFNACNDPSIQGVEGYAKIITDYAIKRRLVHAGGMIATAAYEYEAVEAEAKATSLLLEATERTGSDAARTLEELVTDWQNNTDPLLGLPTGIKDLDDLTGGLHPQEIWVIAARPGLGKTAFVTQVALHLAHKASPVALFSLEMSRQQVLMRMLSNQAQINIQTVYRNQLEEQERVLLSQVGDRLKALPVYIDDSGVLSVEDLRSRALRLKHLHGVKVVIVDYLQLLRAGRSVGTRNDEVAHISRTLMQLAKEIDGSVMAVSQLSRAISHRKDKTPELTDLRESGQIEQDAHVVCFLHADEEDADFENRIELIVAKQRNGPTGARDIYFDRTCGRFGDMDVRHTRHSL